MLGNDDLLTVSVIMAMGSIVSLGLFLMLPERDGDEVVGPGPQQRQDSLTRPTTQTKDLLQ